MCRRRSVDGLAAAHGEEHVRLRRLGPQHLNVLHGGLAAVPEDTDDLQSRALHGPEDLVLGGGQGLLAADDGYLFSIGRADVPNVLIGVRPDGISGEERLFHLFKTPFLVSV